MIKNIAIVDKGTPPRYDDHGCYKNSSNVTAFNIYDQDWTVLQAEGLTRLFNDDKAEFENKKSERNGAINDGIQ